MAISKSIIFVLFFSLFMAAIHPTWGAANKASSFHCLENERNALLSFKHGLTNATALSSWVGQDCCKWEGVGCDDFSGHVIRLSLSGNDLSGQIPMSIGRLSGRIPNSFGRLSNLKLLDLSSNRLNGIVPEILGQLSNLSELSLSDNSFSGVVSELHFAKLSELATLNLGGNTLSLNITSGWVPPFQLENLFLGSCDVGTVFPAWLRTQSSLLQLDMSNAGISESIPHWFVNFTSNLDLLDLSGNQIYGKVPNFKITELYLSSNKFEGFSSDLEVLILDISNNKISGIIPEDIDMLSGLESLSLYNNTINGTIPSSLCKLQDLQFLDLSKNHLSGHLPRCLSELLNLVVLDLTSNNLTGTIPSSFSKLSSLETLHLSKNKFHGEFPSSLQRCGNLSLLDIGGNFLSGDVPIWIGEKLLSLEILGLRSNKFNGSLSPKLCHLNKLRVLDVSNNNLSGIIPRCFNNFSAMVLSPIDLRPTPFYIERSELVIKGREIEYSEELVQLVSSLDLSNNNLVGHIPEELTNLSGLIGLNLAGNNLIGSIPKRIGEMKSLQSLDLSMNHLSGVIPQSILSLFGLSYLNLSLNNLSGRIPSGNQLQTLDDPSIYEGNSELCGYPLQKNCTGDNPPQVDKPPQVPASHDNGSGFISIWFYVGMASGYVVGFWGVCGVLLLKKTWRYAFFRFADDIKDRLFVAIMTRKNRLRRA